MKKASLTAATCLLLCACTAQQDDPQASETAPATPVASPSASQAPEQVEGDEAATPVTPQLVATDWLRGEWLKAENRSTCAPIAFGEVADRGGKPRPANFAGGWAVAFDQPQKRSAYGVAGAGVGTMSAMELRDQWPLVTVPENLPKGSYAGYGAEGAQTYPPDDPDGNSVKSLAYVRVEGQDCLYNVWSNLGRAHLEVMLDSLRLVETGS